MTNPRSDEEALAGGSIDAIDLAALERIEALYAQLDPVPAGFIGRVKFGITLDALHSEIADLQRSVDLVGVRSDGLGDSQTVTFTTARLTTMVTISQVSTDAVRVDGWAVPGAGITVELRTSTATVSTIADHDGRFVFASVQRGMAQFVMRSSDLGEVPILTPPIEL